MVYIFVERVVLFECRLKDFVCIPEELDLVFHISDTGEVIGVKVIPF